MHYLDVDAIVNRPGLRLVLTKGMPGPWGLAAKALFEFKRVDYVAAAQYPGQPNTALARWSGQSGAPVAAFDDEPPKSSWADMIWLAERLAPEPALIPRSVEQRALMFGLVREIAGENGFGWLRRLMIFDQILQAAPADDAMQAMCRKYGYSPVAAATAPQRCLAILAALADQLQRQRAVGSDYFIGTAPSALDLYWAAFSQMLEPLGQAANPMPPGIREFYTLAEAQRSEIDSILIEHRDMIYASHLALPLDYLSDDDV